MFFLARIASVPALRRRLVSADPGPVIASFSPLLVGLAWLVVVAPMLEARVPRSSDRRPPWRRARMCRRFAWTPTVIFSILLVQYVVAKIAQWEDFGWYGPGYGIGLAVGIVLSIAYGRMMASTLERQVRRTAFDHERCYGCNYRLTGLTSGGAVQCPECGAMNEG